MKRKLIMSPFVGGLALAGLLAAKDVFYGNSLNIPVTLAAISGGMLVNRFFMEKKYDKLFRNCGIENKDGEIPIVIKETKKDNMTTLVLHLPEGLSQRHFEQKQQELEQFLNSRIEFGINKEFIMKLTRLNLSSMYKYDFEETDNPLECYCGETHEEKLYLDIAKMPHAIIAGETGSGKSSLLRNMVLSLILNRHDIDLHLIDFQAVELGVFENCKKVRSYGETPEDFSRLLDEIEEENQKRLKLFRSVKNRIFINNLKTWNEKFPKRSLPYKVVVIDEFSRLAEKEYEELMERFRTRVSMDRKVGIHYIISMQRPDVKCISGSIKANMPTRIAFKTVSQVDSEVILDSKGAENLKQAGRFLIKYCGEIKEAQALYVDSDRVMRLLRQHKKFKTREELQEEKAEKMKKLREQCINPYLKKVAQ